MTALESHIEEALDRQLKEVADDPAALAAMQEFNDSVKGRTSGRRQRVRRRPTGRRPVVAVALASASPGAAFPVQCTRRQRSPRNALTGSSALGARIIVFGRRFGTLVPDPPPGMNREAQAPAFRFAFSHGFRPLSNVWPGAPERSGLLAVPSTSAATYGTILANTEAWYRRSMGNRSNAAQENLS